MRKLRTVRAATTVPKYIFCDFRVFVGPILTAPISKKYLTLSNFAFKDLVKNDVENT